MPYPMQNNGEIAGAWDETVGEGPGQEVEEVGYEWWMLIWIPEKNINSEWDTYYEVNTGGKNWENVKAFHVFVNQERTFDSPEGWLMGIRGAEISTLIMLVMTIYVNTQSRGMTM